MCIKTIYNYLPLFSVQFQEIVWAVNTCHLTGFHTPHWFFYFLLQKQDHVIDHVFRHLSIHEKRVTYTVDAFVHFWSFRKPLGRGYYETSSLKSLFLSRNAFILSYVRCRAYHCSLLFVSLKGSLGRGVPQELSNPDPVKRINIHFSTLFNSLVPRAFLREKRGDEVACLI